MSTPLPVVERVYPTERFKHIELEINTACDLACFGCDRFSDVTTAPNMTVEQVELFVRESIGLGWEWERIRLLGGEPTIHPKFRDMVSLLLDYRARFPKVFLQVLSNGIGKLDRHREWLLANRVDPHCETKKKGVTPVWFTNTRITPLDRNPNVGELEPCGIFGLRGCGIGLTRNGFFLDGAGASIAKILGYDIGVQRLEDVTWKAMLGQAKVLCRVCGHWTLPDAPVTAPKVTETGEVTGAFWTEALRKFKENGPPKMTIYGEKKL